jgi:hypothetical protein
LEGVLREVSVEEANNRTYVQSGEYSFTIPKNFGLNLQYGDRVVLQYHLTDTRHPYTYATKALPMDPASRLGISIRNYISESNISFHCWLVTDGEKQVYKMNSLVDHIEGITMQQTMKTPRRWYREVRPGGVREGSDAYTEYESDDE